MESTLKAKADNIPRTMKFVADYFAVWPDCIIMLQWQSIFLSYKQPSRSTVPLTIHSSSPIVAAFARSQASKPMSSVDGSSDSIEKSRVDPAGPVRYEIDGAHDDVDNGPATIFSNK